MTKLSSTLKISRSGLNLFLECPRCFWLDVHHKIKRPPGYPYTLSAAVDYLVKQEFDKYREKGTLPPVFKKELKDARLFNGEQLQEWRNNFKGIAYFDESLNAILYGAVDDVLEFDDGSIAVVDYKSTGAKEITIYDDYKKQMDVYSWILRQKGYEVQPFAYFVFYQVDKTGGGFDNTLKFNEALRKVDTNPDWVADAFEKAVEIARSDKVPSNMNHCDHCHYVDLASDHKISTDSNV